MNRYDGRSEENIKEELARINKELQETLKVISSSNYGQETYDNETGNMKSICYINNDILLKTKRNKRKCGKRQVNKHFLTEAAPSETIEEEEVKNMLNNDELIVDLDNTTITK